VAGLSIHRKRSFPIMWWAIGVVVAIVITLSAYYAYQWYVNGVKPPLVALPATAYADTSVDETKLNLGDINSYTVPASHPRYISIPALGVSKARVQTVVLTKLNTLAMPDNIGDAAWYTESSNPGQGFGQVVIDGHNQGVNHGGIFAGLDNLTTGDKITIERGDGKKITYIVAKTITMTLQDANTSGLKALMKPIDTSKEGLGLITDTGTWIPRDKVFDKRILVWATAESVTDDK
jgi:sortase (surface protein transpeptidase)